MNRREFMRRAGMASAAAAVCGPATASAFRQRTRTSEYAAPPPNADGWRTFEVTTSVRVLKPAGVTRVWLPMPLGSAPYQKTLGDTCLAQGGQSVMVETDDYDVNELDGIQHRRRCPAAALEAWSARVFHVSAGGDREWPP